MWWVKRKSGKYAANLAAAGLGQICGKKQPDFGLAGAEAQIWYIPSFRLSQAVKYSYIS